MVPVPVPVPGTDTQGHACTSAVRLQNNTLSNVFVLVCDEAHKKKITNQCASVLLLTTTTESM
jgi:hypothetical protein